MGILKKFILGLVLCAGASVLAAQESPVSFPAHRSADEIVGFLLDVGTQVHWTEMDCSHFVHYLYEMAGLPYPYADSKALYNGADGFRRVSKPQPGDVIVWEGHAGIVVDPGQHTFLSVLTTGVKTDAYDSHYWKHRGKPRFFRHLDMPNAPHLHIVEVAASHADADQDDGAE